MPDSTGNRVRKQIRNLTDERISIYKLADGSIDVPGLNAAVQAYFERHYSAMAAWLIQHAVVDVVESQTKSAIKNMRSKLTINGKTHIARSLVHIPPVDGQGPHTPKALLDVTLEDWLREEAYRLHGTQAWRKKWEVAHAAVQKLQSHNAGPSDTLRMFPDVAEERLGA